MIQIVTSFSKLVMAWNSGVEFRICGITTALSGFFLRLPGGKKSRKDEQVLTRTGPAALRHIRPNTLQVGWPLLQRLIFNVNHQRR